jgi:hypothetical protein
VAKTDGAVAKPKRIRQLWTKLERETPSSPQYEALAEHIRVLSAEYQELLGAPEKPEKSN